MKHVFCRRRTGLADVNSLADLLAGAWPSRERSPTLPTSTRLGRDVGLPELELGRPLRTPFGQKP